MKILAAAALVVWTGAGAHAAASGYPLRAPIRRPRSAPPGRRRRPHARERGGEPEAERRLNVGDSRRSPAVRHLQRPPLGRAGGKIPLQTDACRAVFLIRGRRVGRGSVPHHRRCDPSSPGPSATLDCRAPPSERQEARSLLRRRCCVPLSSTSRDRHAKEWSGGWTWCLPERPARSRDRRRCTAHGRPGGIRSGTGSPAIEHSGPSSLRRFP